MKNKDQIEPVGIAFLDLISCALAGILVLYVLSDIPDDNIPKDTSKLSFIQVQSDNKSEIFMGVRLTVGTESFESWNLKNNQDIAWEIKKGSVIALLSKEIPTTAQIELIALQVPLNQIDIKHKVIVITKNGIIHDNLTLDKTNFFRSGKLTL